jgi:choloylglycine hydrolase
MKRPQCQFLIALLGSLGALTTQGPVAACSRVLYQAKDGTVITGRSMDWGSDMSSNMWVLPRGMKRDGMGGENSIQWESKYGSVIVSGYDISTAEGMNEKGLVTNLLALVESNYGTPPAGKKVICISTWAQYVLDNFETVAEAVASLEKEEFQVQTTIMPTGAAANMHLSISDASGDSAIFEYVKGKLVIHHGPQFRVMTNSPAYDKQIAIQEYWKDAGALMGFLPGTPRAADRFARALVYLDSIPTETKPAYISGVPQQKFQFQAMMSVLSVMRSVGTPLGITIPDQPFTSSSIWRTVSDSTNRVVLFDSAMAPATFWVKLDDLDLKQGAPVKKLELAGGKTYSGNAADKFTETKLFAFESLH